MPSFKNCIASLALMAFAFSPVSASLLAGDDSLQHVSRRATLGANMLGERDTAAPAALLAKRESRKEAAARIRLAKNRAARKAKRAAKAAAEAAEFHDMEPRSLEARAAKKFRGGVTSVFAGYLDTRCGRDKNCANAAYAANLPTNGVPICYRATRKCVISCQQGYLLQGDGSCKANAVQCGTIANGIYVVGNNGQCQAQCDASLGYSLTTVGGTQRCINTQLDANNCGSVGNVCPSSYNGQGTPACARGQCYLQCRGGTFNYRTASGAPYCA